MEEVEYQQLYSLLNKYKGVVKPSQYELKNDLEFVIIGVRNSALEEFNLILKEEND